MGKFGRIILGGAVVFALVLGKVTGVAIAEGEIVEATPAQQNIEISAGDSYTGIAGFVPSGYSAVTPYTMEVSSYGYSAESQLPEFDTRTDQNEIVDWTMLGITEGAIAENGATIEIPYTINVPECSANSNQYMAILMNVTGENRMAVRTGEVIHVHITGNCGSEGDVGVDSIGEAIAASRQESSEIEKVDEDEGLGGANNIDTSGTEGLGGFSGGAVIIAIVAGVLIIGGVVALIIMNKRKQKKSEMGGPIEIKQPEMGDSDMNNNQGGINNA